MHLQLKSPFVLTAITIVGVIALNYLLWLAMFGYPPTVAGYYHSEQGCYLKYKGPPSEFVTPGHKPRALRDWWMNDVCWTSAILRAIRLKLPSQQFQEEPLTTNSISI